MNYSENLLLEFDKAGAEWVVVAYLADDANMLSIVRSGESPHVATGHLITSAPKELISREAKLLDKTTDPDELLRVRSSVPELAPLLALPFLPRSMTVRQAGKKSNHGLNYGMKYRRFALENEIPEGDAKIMVELYNTVAYPNIPIWHKQVQMDLKKNGRVLTNCFGRKSGRLMGEWGVELFDKAYSFVPQSTVADTVNSAIHAAFFSDIPSVRMADLLTQTHDSATYQFTLSDLQAMADFIMHFAHEEQFMNPKLSYSGYDFRIGTDLKVGLDWGHMAEVKIASTSAETLANLKAVVEQLLLPPEPESQEVLEVRDSAELAPAWEEVPAVVETRAA